jgi:hypothetical protein
MRGRALLLCAASIGFLASCESSTDGTYYDYVAFMHPMKENPAITTAAVANAKGDFTANLDGDILTYTFRFSGLSSNATLAHIHGPAVQTANAGVIVNFDDAANGRTITLGATSGTASGTISLAASTIYGTAPNTFGGDSLKKLLDNGRLYVNVHTVTNGGGEIRGQIVH